MTSWRTFVNKRTDQCSYLSTPATAICRPHTCTAHLARMSPSKTIDAIRHSVREHHQSGLTDDDVEALAQENAAIRIQRAWRAKKRASYLGTDFLWTDLITHARFKVRGWVSNSAT